MNLYQDTLTYHPYTNLTRRERWVMEDPLRLQSELRTLLMT
jgi:hypothetical protein